MLNALLRTSVNIPYCIRPYVRRIPGLAPLHRALVARFLAGRPFVHTVNAGPARGLRFEVSLPLDKAVWAGTYEHAFALELARNVGAGDVCYDIGGYRGYMSGVMALAGAAKVFVFEPLPTNQRALRRLCELNPDLPVQLMPGAAGNVDGRAMLRVMPDTSMAKLVSSPFQPEAAVVKEIEVETWRLDTLVSRGDIPAPNTIKLDVEGAELDVLDGARDLLARHHPRLFVEAHSAALDWGCSERLRQLGYSIVHLDPPIEDGAKTRHLVACKANA